MQFTKLLSVVFLFVFASCVFAVAPTITSTSHPAGVWSSTPFMRFSLAYSGSTGYSYIIDTLRDTIPDENVETTESNLSLGGKADGIYWFHVRARSSSGWSDAAHYEIKIDTTSPLRPTEFSANSEHDGTVKLNWAASTDTLSGVSHYNVYRSALRFVKDGELSREFSIKDAVARKIGAEITETTFVDNNFLLGQGFRFHYKIQPVDNAGNGGTVSSIASVQTLSTCDLTIVLETEVEDNNLSINVVATGKFKKGHLVVGDPSGLQTIVVDSISNVSTFKAGYSLMEKSNGDYNVSFSAIDEDSDQCSAQTIYVYDTTNPQVDITSPANTKELSGVMRFEISASDSGANPSGVNSVSLFYENNGGQLIGQAQLEGGLYVIDWNTLPVANNRYKVVAKATDRGGNVSEDESIYTLKNTVFQRIEAEQAISNAGQKRIEAIAFIENLAKKNIDVDDLNSIIAQADANKDYAQTLFTQGFYYDLAAQQAKESFALYASVENIVAVSDYSSDPYIYNPNQIDVFLAAAGLPDYYKQDAKTLISRSNVSRTLKILQVKRKSGTYYLANVVVSVSNTDSNAVSFNVIEVIPKKFVKNSSEIVSDSGIVVLRPDPVIAFTSVDLNGFEDRDLVYGLAAKLTKAQADSLISAKIPDFYVSPPIVLLNNSSSGLPSFGAASGLSFLPSFLSFDLSDSNFIIVVVAILIILFILFLLLILGAVAVYFFFIKKRK